MAESETEETYVVPEGHYFMMGDNRNYSLDARYWQNHYISRDKMVAKVFFEYFPTPKVITKVESGIYHLLTHRRQIMKKVVKFGGSSLASARQFKKVKAIIEADKTRCYVVPFSTGKKRQQRHKSD